jgi:hypothetical protein
MFKLTWMSFCSLRGAAERGCPAWAASTEGGMTGGRATPSRGLGSATCMRLVTSATRLPCSKPGQSIGCQGMHRSSLTARGLPRRQHVRMHSWWHSMWRWML